MLLTIASAAVGVIFCGPAGTDPDQATMSLDLRDRTRVESAAPTALPGDEGSRTVRRTPDVPAPLDPAASTRVVADDEGSYTPDEDDFDSVSSGGGGTGPCTVSNCTTTCIPGYGPECSCWYQCPSGGTWVVKAGYCPNTSTSCLP